MIKEETDRKADKDRGCCLKAALAIYCSSLITNDLKSSFWQKIHFGKVVVLRRVNQMIIHLSEASILPSVHSSIHPVFWC